MKKFLSLSLFISLLTSAQVTLKITSLPSNTPDGAKIFVAGTFNGWNPSSTPMTKDENGNWLFTILEGNGTVEYKFTRGSWSETEGDSGGKPISNREFTFSGKPQTIQLTVQSWENPKEKKENRAAPNVHILSNSFHIPQLNRDRRIWIYLPPDYENSTKKYPVIYMQDGQNLFDDSTAFAGEWQIDETLNSLFQKGDYGAIVIGIDHGGENRINEYTPWNNSSYGGGEGISYMQFITETLKPFVDANYRTIPDAAHTALIGSSLGALISTYGGVKYCKIFSKIGSFSPAYWIVSEKLNQEILNSDCDLRNMKIYFVAGTQESKTISAEIETVKNNLQSKGLTKEKTLVKMDAYGKHQESYWKGEFAAAYQWLFPMQMNKAAEPKKNNIQDLQKKSRAVSSGKKVKNPQKKPLKKGTVHP